MDHPDIHHRGSVGGGVGGVGGSSSLLHTTNSINSTGSFDSEIDYESGEHTSSPSSLFINGAVFASNHSPPPSSHVIMNNNHPYLTSSYSQHHHHVYSNTNHHHHRPSSSSSSSSTIPTKYQQQQKRFLTNVVMSVVLLMVLSILGYVVYNKVSKRSNTPSYDEHAFRHNPDRFTQTNPDILDKVRMRESAYVRKRYNSNNEDEESGDDGTMMESGVFVGSKQRRAPKKDDLPLVREGDSKTSIVQDDYSTYSAPIEEFMWRGMFKEKMKEISDCPVPFKKQKQLTKVAKTIHTYMIQEPGTENYQEMLDAEKVTDSSGVTTVDWSQTFASMPADCQTSTLVHKRSDDNYLVICQEGSKEPFFSITRDPAGDGTAQSDSAFQIIRENKLEKLEFEPGSKLILDKKQLANTEILVMKCSKGREVVTRIAHDAELQKAANQAYATRVKKLEEQDQDLKEKSKKPKYEHHQYAANIEYEYEMMHPVNVLHIILDGTSRANFMRELPRTVGVLEDIELDQKAVNFKKPSKHRVFQYFRYNTVGHSSRENMLAMENGLKMSPSFFKHYFSSIPEKSYEETEPTRQKELLTKVLVGAKEQDGSRTLIEHNIWNIAKKLGYVTMYSTSECPYVKISDKKYRKKLMDTSSHLFNTWHRADHNLVSLACERQLFKSSKDRKCLGSKDLAEHIFDYTSDFFAKYPGTARFATIHLEESKHLRSHQMMTGLDISLSRFIVSITKAHPHTAIILSSGNGVSHGPLYVTDVGQKEHHLPLLVMVMPEHLQIRHEQVFANMDANQQQLVTPFDLYSTLVHLMLFPQVDLPSRYHLIHKVKAESEHSDEIDDFEAISKSILLPISDQTRYCKQAGVDERWCSCYVQKSLDVTSERTSAHISTILKAAVNHVNKMVQKHKQTCQQIEATKVLKATKIRMQTPEELENGRIIPYIISVVFQSKTGDIFEVDYSLSEEDVLHRLLDVRRISLVEHLEESAKNRETLVCDKVKGFEASPDLCICKEL
ncbi:hypothetical protein FDP41_004787 [Naegleria fowleri]|uniref:Uncharacterized protein n=1 Tax=Naegleria fowleri TaxID=5763 RepID=A0A6A5BMK8_NAEFO|nr:uncharacterized protein FDP41_004787 [Naegleria fowleri]KAF0976112.1 hypothetical protein FDP41_004787 [Naegleria fowleri]CAG4718771.1 unnamed protein product [Naegleria fowleri]